MINERKAPISPDEVGSIPLGHLTGDQFVQLLNNRDVASFASVITDKKKYELWVEENLGGITVGDFLGRLRQEKKKVELEKIKIEDLVLKRALEDPPDPRRQFIDPVIFERIVARLDAIEERLGQHR
jgi:hypothetical protein